MRRAVIARVLLMAIAGTTALLGDAVPQPTSSTPQVPIRHFDDTADHVRIIAVTGANSGNDDRAVVVITIDPGYHINANPTSLGYLISTTLNVTRPTPLRVIYPDVVRFKPKFSEDVLDVYEGTIHIIAEFPKGTLLGEGPLFGTLTAQACTEKFCLPPAEIALPVILRLDD
jgi:hypothetical protein